MITKKTKDPTLPNKGLDKKRKGVVAVLAGISMTMLMAAVAFAVDIGYVMTARTQLQSAADSAALAAGWELLNQGVVENDLSESGVTSVRSVAASYAAMNKVFTHAPTIDLNPSNATTGDVVVGYLPDFAHPETMFYGNLDNYNAVTVRIRQTSGMNGEIGMLFSRVLGIESIAMQSQATAALLKNIQGFKPPSDGSNLDILPIALDLETWDNYFDEAPAYSSGSHSSCSSNSRSNCSSSSDSSSHCKHSKSNCRTQSSNDDQWKWNEITKRVVPGSDGIKEINLYPQGTGSPGNRGTVDIGGANNSTADIKRQIQYGVSAEDLSQIGGKLALGSNGTTTLKGDTGLSAGIESALDSVVGKNKVIPIFSTVTGPGNNATYTIVGFVGVKILDTQLTGSSKHLTVQPTTMMVKGAVPVPSSGESTPQYSYGLYTPVHLVH